MSPASFCLSSTLIPCWIPLRVTVSSLLVVSLMRPCWVWLPLSFGEGQAVQPLSVGPAAGGSHCGGCCGWARCLGTFMCVLLAQLGEVSCETVPCQPSCLDPAMPSGDCCSTCAGRCVLELPHCLPLCSSSQKGLDGRTQAQGWNVLAQGHTASPWRAWAWGWATYPHPTPQATRDILCDKCVCLL